MQARRLRSLLRGDSVMAGKTGRIMKKDEIFRCERIDPAGPGSYIMGLKRGAMPIIEEGVYIEIVTQEIGTGATARKQEIRNVYLAETAGADEVRVRLLDMNDQPLPIQAVVTLQEFRRRFTHQPGYFQKKKNPQEQKIDKAIAQADLHFRKKEYYSAEFEYEKALKLDEENVRANFGIGKVYLAKGETEKARETFEKLAHVEAVFEPGNKHIFNELGMELRRMGLHDEAIEYYEKSLSFTRDDENLLFNTARAFHEKGDLKSAVFFLEKALELNPDLGEGRKMMALIRKKGGA